MFQNRLKAWRLLEMIRVGIDVDGVLRDFVGKVLELVEEETGIALTQPTEYYFDSTETGVSYREKLWKTKEWAVPIFEESTTLPNAKEGFQQFLNNDKYDVYIVSAQRKGTEHHTDKWLKKNGFYLKSKVIYTENKLNAPCQILIDDMVRNVKAYNDNARLGVLVDATYNQEYNTHNRVKNLKRAYELLEEKHG